MILVLQQCRSHPHYSTGQRLALPWLPDCTSSGAILSFLPLDPTVPASFDLDADRDMLAVIRGTQAVYARTDETVHLLEIRFRVGGFRKIPCYYLMPVASCRLCSVCCRGSKVSLIGNGTEATYNRMRAQAALN